MRKFLLYRPTISDRFGHLFFGSGYADPKNIYEFEVNLDPKANIMVGTVLEVPIPKTEKVAVLWVGKREDCGDLSSPDHCRVDVLGIGNKENGDIDQSNGSLFHSFVMEHWTKKEFPITGK